MFWLAPCLLSITPYNNTCFRQSSLRFRSAALVKSQGREKKSDLMNMLEGQDATKYPNMFQIQVKHFMVVDAGQSVHIARLQIRCLRTHQDAAGGRHTPRGCTLSEPKGPQWMFTFPTYGDNSGSYVLPLFDCHRLVSLEKCVWSMRKLIMKQRNLVNSVGWGRQQPRPAEATCEHCGTTESFRCRVLQVCLTLPRKACRRVQCPNLLEVEFPPLFFWVV